MRRDIAIDPDFVAGSDLEIEHRMAPDFVDVKP